MITTRHHTPADAAALVPLFQEMQRHYDVPCPPEATILRDLAKLPEGVGMLVAETDQIVGFGAFGAIYPGPHLKPGLFLKELFVAESARGLGAGRALMRALAAHAVERGYGRIDWTADRDDLRLLGFYDGLGAVRQEAKLFYRLSGVELAGLAERDD